MPIVVTYDIPSNTILVTGGTAGTPATFTDILAADILGGWGVITNPCVNVYCLSADLRIGDNIIPTFLKTLNESISFNNQFFYILANAIFQSGDFIGGQPINGSYIKVIHSAWWDIGWGATRGTFNAYASLFHFNNNQSTLIRPLLNWNKVILIFHSTWAGGDNYYQQNSLIDVTQIHGGAVFLASPSVFIRYIHDRASAWQGVQAQSVNDITILNAQVTNDAHPDYRWRNSSNIGRGLILRNPITKPTQATCHIDANGRFIREEYTCNIHVVDRDGAAIQNATVACEDQFGNPVFSVNTDVNGNIVEQIITYRQWIDTSETEATYSPHLFTISRAGYETLELDDVTVDAPIAWHLELLPLLAETDVRLGTGYGEDKTGLLDLPSINDVEDGVFFDGATKEGNFEAPAEGDVEVGVGYGSLGVEFVGTYLGLRGTNLTAYLSERVDLTGQLQQKVNLSGELKP